MTERQDIKKDQEIWKPRNPEEEIDKEHIQGLLDFANKFYHASEEEKGEMKKTLLQDTSKIKTYALRDMIKNLTDITNTEYKFEPSKTDDSWLWYQPQGSEYAYVVPGEIRNFNIGQQITIASRLFDGMEILYKKGIGDIDFERIVAPAHLMRRGEIFKIKNRGEIVLRVETAEETEKKKQARREEYQREEEIMKVKQRQREEIIKKYGELKEGLRKFESYNQNKLREIAGKIEQYAKDTEIGLKRAENLMLLPQSVLQKKILIKKVDNTKYALIFQNLFDEVKIKEDKIEELEKEIKEIERSIEQNKLSWKDKIPVIGSKKKKIEEEIRLDKIKENKKFELKRLEEELKAFSKKEIEVLKFDLERLMYIVGLGKETSDGNLRVIEILNKIFENLESKKENPLGALKQEELELYNKYIIIKNELGAVKKEYD